MKIIVESKRGTILFTDGSDRERYISCIVKMTKDIEMYKASLIIVGFINNKAEIVFKGGDEDIFKKIVQRVHISYSAYRRNKKMPVSFEKSKFLVLDGNLELSKAVRNIKRNAEYLCTFFDENSNVMLNFNMKEYAKVEKLNVEAAREYAVTLEKGEMKKYLNYLRKKYRLSYRKLGSLFNCSFTKIYRIMNR